MSKCIYDFLLIFEHVYLHLTVDLCCLSATIDRLNSDNSRFVAVLVCVYDRFCIGFSLIDSVRPFIQVLLFASIVAL